MSSFTRKTASIVLSVTTAMWLSGAAMIVPAASAATADELQAQIQALLAQIAQLQAQIGASTGTAAMTSACSFTRDLTLGSKGDDVKCLQQTLNANGYAVAASGAGSPGSETTYFGPATRSALSKWQAAKGVTPSVGYFGPKTRTAISSMAVAPTTPTTTPTTPTAPSVVAPASGLAVSVAADNPAAGSLISSSASAAARVPLVRINLTAGVASGVTVSDITFTKQGVLADSSVSGAYLVENGKVLAQYASFSGGKLKFTGLNLSVAAGQTRKVELAIDPATGLTAGNTVSFDLAAASEVVATDAMNASVTPSGIFPVKGSTFTVTSVSNPSIATLTVASSSIGTTVTAGTNDNIVGAWTFTAANSKVKLGSINFKVIGSANKSDIKNVKLFVNGTQAGNTLASVASDGSAYFDTMSNMPVLNTGANNIQLKSDIAGSPSFTFQFEILNAYDVYVVDSTYNVPITAASNIGTQVTINQGQVTLTAASDTPSGNVAKGQSNVTLAKFSFYAAGEAVKMKWIGFSLVFTGGAGATLDSYIKNVNLVDDAGNQIGSTISSLTTTVTCTDTVQATATTTASNCFGNSTSPINYIVPANTTRILSLKGDVQSAADFSSVVARTVANTNNLQGMTSSQNASTPSVTGASLSLATNALTVGKNSAIGTQTFTKGATARKVGSYALTAASAEGVRISTITITLGANGGQLANLMLKVGTTQFGTTQGVVANSGVYSFSGTEFTVPAGGTTIVDVIADVLSSATAGTKSAITTLSGCTGSGATSLTSISCTSTAGQDIVVAGQATIQVAIDSGNTPATGQSVMGKQGLNLAAFRFTETASAEDVKVTDLNVFQQVGTTSTVKSAFSNMKLYKSSDLNTALATANAVSNSVSNANPGSGYYYKFSFATPLVVPQGGSVSLVLKGDVNSYSSSGATDNTTHVFKIVTSTDTDNDTLAETVVALGNTSNATASVSLATGSAAPTANTLTVLRTKLSIAGTGIGNTSSRSKQSTDDLATVTFSADSAGTAVLNTITLTFSGTAPSAANFLDGVVLLDSNGTNVTSSLTGVTVTSSNACTGSNTCTKSWSFGTTTSGFSISGGSSYSFKLRIDSTKSQTAVANISQTLNATVQASGDVTYTTGLDGAAVSAITLQATDVPKTLNSVSYSSGT